MHAQRCTAGGLTQLLPFCCVSVSTTELDACTVDPGLTDSILSSSWKGPPAAPWGWASMLAVSILRAASSCCACWAAFSAATARASALRLPWFRRCTSTLKADTCAQDSRHVSVHAETDNTSSQRISVSPDKVDIKIAVATLRGKRCNHTQKRLLPYWKHVTMHAKTAAPSPCAVVTTRKHHCVVQCLVAAANQMRLCR